MRIIGGIFKGKKIFLPVDKITRPLRDLVKESIFNLIQHSNKININIKDSLVLDLFAGSGSFGLECISRGANKVFFFENYSEALKILNKNIKSLKNIKNYEIYKKNCFDFFKSDKEIKINEVLEEILKKNLLNKKGIIIIHRHKKDTIEITTKLNVFENRTYGISNIFFGN